MTIETDLETRRRKLRFRSWHRGTKELDLLMGPFADAHIDTLGAQELEDYAELMLEPDPDVYTWLVGQAEPPAEKMTPVLRMIIDFHKNK